MWILSTIGFFSIVQKPWDRERDTLTIRARVRADLESLRDRYLPEMEEITKSTDSDYRFRAVADREICSAAMAKLMADTTYDNFKDAVADRQGYERANVYGDVWHILYRLQHTRHPVPPITILAQPSHRPNSRPRSNDYD